MSYQFGFANLKTETDSLSLTIGGAIPAWLNGSLIRTGPAKFSVGTRSFNHWFDGLAMLHRFSFADGKIVYTSRFLKSNAFADATATGKISSHEFATNPVATLLERLSSLLSYKPTDNGNVNVTKVDNCFLALTETPTPVQFEPVTLNTIGHFAFADSLTGQATTAHPHFDRGMQFNLLINMGQHSTYQLYALSENTRTRRLIASFDTDRPSYMHSFSATENYLILLESPFKINPLELILSGKPYIQNYHWHTDVGTRILVFDKNGGGLKKTFEADPGFTFHTVNAFERDREIVVDAAMYPDASIVQALYLSNLRSESGTVPGAALSRMRLNLDTGVTNREEIMPVGMELPRINYAQVNGKSYKYVYSGGIRHQNNWVDQLVKTDVETGTTTVWFEDACFPGEPVFVAQPGTDVEDLGIILSLVLDADKQQCFLLILDAQTMQEISRSHVPSIIPFHFHGQFFTGV